MNNLIITYVNKFSAQRRVAFCQYPIVANPCRIITDVLRIKAGEDSKYECNLVDSLVAAIRSLIGLA